MQSSIHLALRDQPRGAFSPHHEALRQSNTASSTAPLITPPTTPPPIVHLQPKRLASQLEDLKNEGQLKKRKKELEQELETKVRQVEEAEDGTMKKRKTKWKKRGKGPTSSICIWMSIPPGNEGSMKLVASRGNVHSFLVRNVPQSIKAVMNAAAQSIRSKWGLRYKADDLKEMCTLWKLNEPLRKSENLADDLMAQPVSEIATPVLQNMDIPYSWDPECYHSHIKYIVTIPHIDMPVIKPPRSGSLEWADEDRILRLYQDFRDAMGIVLKLDQQGSFVLDITEPFRGVVNSMTVAGFKTELIKPATGSQAITKRRIRVEEKKGVDARATMEKLGFPSPSEQLLHSPPVGASPSPTFLVSDSNSETSIGAASETSTSPDSETFSPEALNGTASETFPRSYAGTESQSMSSDTSSQFGVIDKTLTKRERNAWQPSTTSPPAVQTIVQNSYRHVLNGRHIHNGGDRQAPFIGLYADIFVDYEQTRKDYRNKNWKFDWKFIRDVYMLVSHLMTIEASGGNPETQRLENIRKSLSEILNIPLATIELESGSKPDFIYLILRVGCTSIVVEVKAEIASYCDPFVQSANSYVASCQSHWEQLSVASTCAPSFIIGLAGPYISIGAAVLTSRVIVQQLNGSGFQFSTYAAYPTDDDRLHSLCCAFMALRECLAKLNAFYNCLSVERAVKCDPRLIRVKDLFADAHQRFFPWPKSFIYTTHNNQRLRVHFRYLCPLTTAGSCLTFKVMLVPPPSPQNDPHPSRDQSFRAIPNASWEDIITGTLLHQVCDETPLVIKFVKVYGKEAHDYMTSKSLAPRLHSYDVFEMTSGYGGLKMVVMDFVDGMNLHGREIPEEYKEELQLTFMCMHEAGFVHGDIRPENIMVTCDHRVMIIDFNTAARYARFPLVTTKRVKKESQSHSLEANPVSEGTLTGEVVTDEDGEDYEEIGQVTTLDEELHPLCFPQLTTRNSLRSPGLMTPA
ncbi:hypothetical protein WG66_003091 [Moniliophthora roreri]|nr:hypothetical protein WG66_003091 [Moniliophthora roreri]